MIGARWPKATFYVLVFRPTAHKLQIYRISFQNHRTGLNTTRTKTQALSAWCGGNMTSRNTMLLVFSSGGSGSFRSRERSDMVSKTASKLFRKAQHFRLRSNQYFQNKRVRWKTAHSTRQALPACCGGDMTSRRNKTPLSFSRGCDSCRLRFLSAAVADQTRKNWLVTTSCLLRPLHSTVLVSERAKNQTRQNKNICIDMLATSSQQSRSQI